VEDMAEMKEKIMKITSISQTPTSTQQPVIAYDHLKAWSTGKLMMSKTGSGTFKSLRSIMKKRWYASWWKSP